jgi:hypothetical protein
LAITLLRDRLISHQNTYITTIDGQTNQADMPQMVEPRMAMEKLVETTQHLAELMTARTVAHLPNLNSQHRSDRLVCISHTFNRL